MPALVWEVIASLLTLFTHLHMAVFILILPATYMRPSEFLVNNLLPTVKTGNMEEKNLEFRLPCSSKKVQDKKCNNENDDTTLPFAHTKTS